MSEKPESGGYSATLFNRAFAAKALENRGITVLSDSVCNGVPVIEVKASYECKQLRGEAIAVRRRRECRERVMRARFQGCVIEWAVSV